MTRVCFCRNIFKNIFSVLLLSVLRGHSVFSSPPQRPMTSDFEGFSIPDLIHYIYFPILILEPVFPFLMFSAKQGNYLVLFFITSLVWRGRWLGIEPGTSLTRSQQSTTRLSRRLCTCSKYLYLFDVVRILFHGNLLHCVFEAKERFNIKTCLLLKTRPVRILLMYL